MWPSVRSEGRCIVVAVEREIKFAPQTRFSPAISCYRKHGWLTNSQLHAFAQPRRFKPAQIERAIVRSYSARRNWHEMNANCCIAEEGRCVSLHTSERVYAASTATINIVQYISISIPVNLVRRIRIRTFGTNAQINFQQIDENANNTLYLTPRVEMKAKWKVHNYFSVKSGEKLVVYCIERNVLRMRRDTAVFVSIYIFLRMLNRWSSLFRVERYRGYTFVVPIILWCVKKNAVNMWYTTLCTLAFTYGCGANSRARMRNIA